MQCNQGDYNFLGVMTPSHSRSIGCHVLFSHKSFTFWDLFLQMEGHSQNLQNKWHPKLRNLKYMPTHKYLK